MEMTEASSANPSHSADASQILPIALPFISGRA
jgi:hypothetical protein